MRRASIVLLGILGAASPAWADWRSLKSDHFLVIGDATDRDLRDVALQLEQFREVVSRLIPGALRADNSPPVVAIVFRSLGSFEPFMPKQNGRTVRVAGYFQPGEDVNYITLAMEDGAEGLPVVLHEFSHLLLRGVMKDAPVWFNEGLAEYYSSFEMRDGGRRAIIGTPIAHHARLLRERRLPFARFFAVDRNSPEYTQDTTDREVLYAQAWAIVHHAFHDTSKRRDQLLAFVRSVANGQDTPTAFRESYGIEVQALELEVQRYVQKDVYSAVSVPFDERVATRIPPSVRLADAEADAWLGDLLAHLGRPAEAEARVAKALAADPNLALAHATLGTLRLRENKTAEGRELLQKAISLGNANEFINFAYAYELLSGGTTAAAELEGAVRALERALQSRPGYTEAKLLLAYAYLSMNRAEAARDLLAPLVNAEPSNHRAALRLAEAFLRLEEVQPARRLLGPVLARSTDSTERDRARQLLGVASGLQVRRETLTAAGRAPSAANGAAPPSSAGASPAAPAPRERPMFRPIGSSEQRTYGILEAIECSPDQVVLVVRTSDSVVRARAARFMDVEFTAFRKLARMEVSCGKQQPSYEIYLTWRPEGADRRAVAVEVLPEGFLP